jgi:hypothetical protein
MSHHEKQSEPQRDERLDDLPEPEAQVTEADAIQGQGALAASSDDQSVGLLLPAVQKVREAAAHMK